MTNFKHLALFLFSGFLSTTAFAVEEGYPVYYNSYTAEASCNSYNSSGACIQRAVSQNRGYSSSQSGGYNSQNSQRQQGYSNYNQQSEQSSYQSQQNTQQNQRVSQNNGYQKFTPNKGKRKIDLGIWAGRRFADFEYQLNFGYSYNSGDFTSEGSSFSKPAGSILEWDDMVFNELGLTGRYDFEYKKYPLFVFGEYKQGRLEKSGDSRDDDLTVDDLWDISIGGIEASTEGFKFGIGWDDAFSWADFTFSPVLGYMTQTHELNMTNQIYAQPDQSVYVYGDDGTDDGTWIYEDDSGDAHACLWNTDIDGFTPGANWFADIGGGIITVFDFDNGGSAGLNYLGNGWLDCDAASNYCGTGDVNYQVSDGAGGTRNIISYDDLLLFDIDAAPGDSEGCMLGGYDVSVALGGQTQKYEATWSGFFIGTYMDRQFNARESLSFYAQIAMLDYTATADWVYRTDLAHPSFEDNANGMGYELRMTYTREFAPSWDFVLSVEWETFELSGGTTTINYADGTTASEPFANYAVWQSMGLRLGVVKKF